MWSELRGLKDEIDFGTPPRDGAPVTLEIDGVPVTVPAGSSVMLAAAAAGRRNPQALRDRHAGSLGSCRVCLVEIEGRGGFPASCTTPVAEGMKVRTQTETLQRLRKGVLELYLSDFPESEIAGGWSEFHETLKAEGVAVASLRQGSRTISTRRSTPRTPISCSIRRNASSAAAACAPAPRCRAHSRSPSPAAASTRKSPPARTSRSSNRNA